MIPARLVVSGIDGGLVDPQSLDYDAARPAIAALARLAVPLVLCTSRTRGEATFLWRVLGLAAPLIVENGALLLVPAGHLRRGVPGGDRDGEFHVLRLGPPRQTLARALADLESASGVEVRRLADLPAREQPPSLLAAGAPAREHTEPFLLKDADAERALADAAAVRGLRVARGGHALHLCGGADKGLALRTLLSLYERDGGRPATIGLGTWPLDLPMLRAVERPILLPGPDGTIDAALAAELPHAERAAHGGPAGWSHGVLGALAEPWPGVAAPLRAAVA